MAKKNDIYAESVQKKIFGFYAQKVQECNQAYSVANDEKIINLYTPVNGENNKNTLLTKTSIVLLTANKYERNSLHKRIFESTNRKIKQFKIDLLTACEQFNEVYAYSFDWNNNTFLHIHANVTGSYTIGGSADVVRWIRSNNYLFPKLIISFGICFGTDSNGYKIGDVIISDKIYPYFIGAKINKDKNTGEDKLTVVDDNAFRIGSKMYNRINNLLNNNLFKKLPFDVDMKSYITGEAVVSSQKARTVFDGITTQKTPVGEMEGYGVFKECNCSDFKIPCLILKSICDWAVEKNFDLEDENTLRLFKEMYNASNENIGDEEVKQLLGSLKDRLQAYSASCAFSTLEIIMNTCEKDISLFGELRTWMLRYNGAAITCKEIIDKATAMSQSLNIRCKPLDRFVHRSIMILVNEDEDKRIECKAICDTKKDECHGNIDQATVFKKVKS